MLAYLTPDIDSEARTVCRRFSLPSFLWPYVNGALTTLLEPGNWEPFGSMPVDDVIQAFYGMIDGMAEGCMIGQIVYFYGALPPHVLECDGSQFDAQEYPSLYEYLGSDTLPDLSGVFLLSSKERTYNLGDTGGQKRVTLSVDEMPEHSHGYTPPIPNIDIESPGAPDLLAAGVGTMIQTTQVGGNASHENMPPYHVVNIGIVAR